MIFTPLFTNHVFALHLMCKRKKKLRKFLNRMQLILIQTPWEIREKIRMVRCSLPKDISFESGPLSSKGCLPLLYRTGVSNIRTADRIWPVTDFITLILIQEWKLIYKKQNKTKKDTDIISRSNMNFIFASKYTFFNIMTLL